MGEREIPRSAPFSLSPTLPFSLSPTPMCGIAGLFHFASDDPVDAGAVARMNALLRHRGPDDEGVWAGGRAALGNRRLAIIDRAGGAQPMGNDDGTAWITYNGELFNFEPLRAELERAGYRFRTRSDTEVVLRAYEAWGERCVERFNGQFAFAVWDGRAPEAERLFLARDPMGIAPLHYAVADGRLAFASEAKALVEPPLPRPAVDGEGIVELFLCGTLFDGRTLFEGVRTLPPGCAMTVSAEGCRLRRYWAFPLKDGAAPEDPERYYGERMLPLLDDAVRLRLVGEVPLGMMLSGGLDSSTISALAARAVEGPIQTFTLDFPNRWKGQDRDSHYAEVMAEALGARHHAFWVDGDAYYDVLEKLCWHLERPFNKGAASMYLFYERVRDHATVVLTGEGADELFAGYVGSSGLGLDDILATGAVRFFPWAPHWRESLALFSDDFRARYRPQEAFEARLADSLAAAGTDDLLNRALYLYANHFLTELIELHDRTSLAFGVETRLPFMDHRFIDLVAPMPSDLKWRGGETKYLFKRAIEGLLPPEILHRKKAHMPIPRDPVSLLRQVRLTRELVLAPGARTRAYYDAAQVDDFLERRNAFAEVGMVTVWQVSLYLITLELHHRVFGL
jgi:asparagine synthase (glutamine-hydrolysing)